MGETGVLVLFPEEGAPEEGLVRLREVSGISRFIHAVL